MTWETFQSNQITFSSREVYQTGLTLYNGRVSFHIYCIEVPNLEPEKTADIWRRYHWFPRKMTSFCGETSGSVAKCQLFSQATQSTAFQLLPI